jgi:uncharacterized membrane protein HdeD (DUF308 family)
MQEQIKGAAWSLGLWGVFSIIFGLLIVAWPGITLKVFLIILGIYLLASGVVLLIGSLLRHTGHWIGGALMGGISVIAGLYVFAHPQASALVVLSLLAIWAVVVGVLQVVAGFEGKNNWWLVISGLIYTLFGVYVFANPKGGAIAVIWLIGLTVIAGGVVSAIAALKLVGVEKRLSKA